MRACVCVCMCVWVCMCHNELREQEEWQGRPGAQTILVSKMQRKILQQQEGILINTSGVRTLQLSLIEGKHMQATCKV